MLFIPILSAPEPENLQGFTKLTLFEYVCIEWLTCFIEQHVRSQKVKLLRILLVATSIVAQQVVRLAFAFEKDSKLRTASSLWLRLFVRSCQLESSDYLVYGVS